MRIPGRPINSAAPVVAHIESPTSIFPDDPATVAAPATPAAKRPGSSAGTAPPDPFSRVARLAATALGRPLATVTIIGGSGSSERVWATTQTAADQPSPIEQSLRRFVLDSGNDLMIDDVTGNLPGQIRPPSGPTDPMSWAGFPVHGPDGQVVGALCVTDLSPRSWSFADSLIVADLAEVASTEVALRIALRRGADRAVLARTLQQILLPPRLPKVPGTQIAARYLAGGTGAEILGDFYDVFPSVRGSWGVVVGDVCGKGIPAAKNTALARHTLRGEALRQTRPSLILAGLNQALLDWPTDDPRFLTAIYATVRPLVGAISVRISSAGHPLALVRRAGGRTHPVGQPGTLLGLLPDPDLYDTRHLLRAGDSLILITDGVTEARSHIDRDLYGDERLADLIAGLGNVSAVKMAAAVIKAARAFCGGVVSDDTVVLVLKAL